MRRDADTGHADVLVVGSGPAGLACAAELTACGVRATVLEKGPSVGAAWASRYDRLRFNTSRLHSALPGAPFPREFGQFPTRDQYVGYLQQYADHRGVQVETGCEVTAVEQAGGAGWLLRTTTGPRRAADVVVATGPHNRPFLPGWAVGSHFTGPVVHTSTYRNAEPFSGKDVVVVGAGSTGMEVAHELARGGAATVRLSVRTPPNILPRVMGGLPGDLPVPLFLHLPTALVDGMLRRMQTRVVGDLTPYGLPPATEGVMAGLRRRGAGTAIVDDDVLEAIRDGSIRVVPAVIRLDADGVVLADGSHEHADAVLLATGFTTGLESLVGHLGVLDPGGMPLDRGGGEVLPGLRFLGYVYRPGITGYVGKLAKRVAREIAGRPRVRVAA